MVPGCRPGQSVTSPWKCRDGDICILNVKFIGIRSKHQLRHHSVAITLCNKHLVSSASLRKRSRVSSTWSRFMFIYGTSLEPHAGLPGILNMKIYYKHTVKWYISISIKNKSPWKQSKLQKVRAVRLKLDNCRQRKPPRCAVLTHFDRSERQFVTIFYWFSSSWPR